MQRSCICCSVFISKLLTTSDVVHVGEFGRIWAAWVEVFGCIIVALSVVGGQQLEAAQLQTAAAPSRPVHRPVQQLELAAAAARGGGMLWETLVSPALTHASSPCHAASWSMIIFNWNFLDNFSWPSLIAQTYWWWCGKERFGRLLLWFDIFTRSWVEGFFLNISWGEKFSFQWTSVNWAPLTPCPANILTPKIFSLIVLKGFKL